MDLRICWFSFVCMSGFSSACSKPARSGAASPAEPSASTAAPADGPALPVPPPGAKVAFLEPSDGSVVEGPNFDGMVRISVKMKVEGLALHPAEVPMPNSGHHHVIVDGAPFPLGTRIYRDEQHLHYEKGQRDVVVQLTPGKHTLTLQFANADDISFGPQLSSTISVDAKSL